MGTSDSWQLAEGDAITPELTAMRLLGGGSSYEAYLAFDDITYSPVVAKLVRPHLVEDRQTLRGLRREAEALATVNHPVVVRGLRHVADGARPHLVMEQIDGPRLSTLIRRYGPLQEQQYLPLAIEIAASLHYLRRIGWTHLDIKPSNVIMGAPARLIDLSVARTVDAAADLTSPIGTDAYMSPEQAEPPHTGRPGPAVTSGGCPRPSSRQSRATGPSTTATRTPRTSRSATPSSWTSRTSFPRECRTRSPRSSAPGSRRTRRRGRCRTRSRTRWSRSWPASPGRA